MNPYYIVVEEWLYPAESGREVHADTFDSEEDAIRECEAKRAAETANFSENCRCEAVAACAAHGQDMMCVLTPRECDDPWYYAARVLRVDPVQPTQKEAI